MPIQLNEEEIDDLIYLSRAGEKDELLSLLESLSARDKASTAEILTAAKDESKSTCLHMATGNGHLGTLIIYKFHVIVWRTASDRRAQIL